MKNKVLAGITVLICISLFLCSCASKPKPKFKGSADLCGLVIDENNLPVKDFVVWCEPVKLLGARPGPVLTNESGLFVFYGVPSGEYVLCGEKNNYLRVESVVYDFNDRTRIICLQTKSLRAAVVKAEQLLGLGQAAEAGDVLGKICCEADSQEDIFFKQCLAKIKEVSE